jgi:acetyl-CoA acetyltransferase
VDTDVWILGGCQSDFARNLTKEGLDFADLTARSEKTVPGDTAAHHLGAAAWTGHEGADAKFLWPSMFAQLADEYERRYGLDETHLHAIAQLNFANARPNPNAQTRDWTVPDPMSDDDATNPVIVVSAAQG